MPARTPPTSQRDPPGPGADRHRRRPHAAVLHRHRRGDAAPGAALDRDRRADDVPPDRRRARARRVGRDRRDAVAADAVDAFASGWLFMAVTAVLAGLALLPMAVGGSSIDWSCDLRRDPRDVPQLLRAQRPPAPCRRRRSSRPQHDPSALLTTRGHAPAQAVLPRPREAAAHPADHVPEVLPHPRHRRRGLDRAPQHVLRDARQLLDRRLLQGGRHRVRAGALGPGLRARLRPHLGHGLRGRRGARPRPGRRGDRGVGGGGLPARAHRGLQPRRRTSGRRARPAPAGRARSSTTTAA